MDDKLTLTREWDKTFPKSEKVNHSKVMFHNRCAVHTGLYDRLDVIPFDKLEGFFRENRNESVESFMRQILASLLSLMLLLTAPACTHDAVPGLYGGSVFQRQSARRELCGAQQRCGG